MNEIHSTNYSIDSEFLFVTYITGLKLRKSNCFYRKVINEKIDNDRLNWHETANEAQYGLWSFKRLVY